MVQYVAKQEHTDNSPLDWSVRECDHEEESPAVIAWCRTKESAVKCARALNTMAHIAYIIQQSQAD